jgi:hypothetical protein
MVRGVYCLADINFAITFQYPENAKRYFAFSTNGIAQYSIVLSKERLYREKEDLESICPNRSFSPIEIEFNALYREISDILYQYGVIVFHSVLVGLGGEGFLFTGNSGVGKSTHAINWTKVFPGKAQIINGDKTLLRIVDNSLFGYGSPWMGKEKIGYNGKIKITAIYFLNQSQTNEVFPMEKDTITIEYLIRQTMIQSRGYYLPNLFRWYTKAIEFVNLYRLNCTKDKESALVAYNGANR